MQLSASARTGPLRSRLGAAACVLIASATAGAARAQGAAGTTQFEAAALVYGEQDRTNVVEPIARITRVLPDGQSFSAQLGLDVITGASPTGASPPGRVQTVTTASGNVTTLPADRIPTTTFSDFRGALDLGWTRPLGALVSPTLGTHLSREKDYQSLGANGQVSVDLLHRRTTLTAGGGRDHDRVFPVGGIVQGLSDGLATGESGRGKDVATYLMGVSQVVSRRWLVGLSVTRTDERGYLTEPYKVLSVVDSGGYPVSELREKRPESRRRTSVLLSSVYHLRTDVLHASYRAYRDDWGVRSHTVDLKLRHELGDDRWVQPHVRLYWQSAADFFRFSLSEGDALPLLATSDGRLGPLRTATLGAAYGLRLGTYPGEFTVRAEYIAQWGAGHPKDAVGVQRGFDLMPLESIGSLTLGYSVNW